MTLVKTAEGTGVTLGHQCVRWRRGTYRRGPAMDPAARGLGMLVTVGALAACAPLAMAPDDREHVCRVTVERHFDVTHFDANPLAQPASGPLAGAAGGAFAALPWSIGPQAIVTLPLGAVVGAGMGTVCAAAGASHPNAEADFENTLCDADAGSLTRALEADLRALRSSCEGAPADTSNAATADTIIHLDEVHGGMDCAMGKQTYWIAVKWRAVAVADRRVLVQKTTLCRQTSALDVGDWLGDLTHARVEIEAVLAATGRRIGTEFRATAPLAACNLRSTRCGKIEER